MKWRILPFIVCLLLLSANAIAQVKKLVANKYWQYDHSHYDKDRKPVYTFKSITPDSLDEVALYFKPNGQFKEITNPQKHPKPARKGKWHVKGDTLVLNFPDKRWNYKILFMSNKEFQCTMSN